jgi:hypothetical protein
MLAACSVQEQAVLLACFDPLEQEQIKAIVRLQVGLYVDFHVVSWRNGVLAVAATVRLCWQCVGSMNSAGAG